MENENLKPVKELTPFTKMIMTIGTLPSSFYSSMSYYESMVWLYEYLKNQVIPAVNNNAESLDELQTAFITLKDYIDNYFENLDVQEEINKKLDEMAEDGTLSNLIGLYVDPRFNTYTSEINHEFNEFKDNINEQVDEINNKVSSLDMGSPLVASSTSEMVDTSKIYVNTTDGNWYYYTNNTWNIGGVYQSEGISDNSINPEMLKYVSIYNLYDISKITYNTLGGNYQGLLLPANEGQKYGAFIRWDGEIVRSYANNGYNNMSTLIYFYDSNYVSMDGAQGRIATNINPTDDVTAPANTKYVALLFVNVTTNPYYPDDVLFCEMTDKIASDLVYKPFGYYFKTPYRIDESEDLNERLTELEETVDDNVKLYPHKDKKILGLGDSYTFLDYYGPYLENETKTTFTPRGYNGAAIKYFVNDNYTPTGGGGAISSLPITSELLAQYDAVTIMGGTNNYGQSIEPLGTINDNIGANTVHGEIKFVIDKLLTLKPDIEIIWCTEPFRLSYGTQPAPGGYDPNSQGYTMQDVANAIIEECKHYGLPCYDFYSNSQWNSYSIRREDGDLVSNKFTYDGLHPKDGDGNGADLLGRSFGSFINTLRF